MHRTSIQRRSFLTTAGKALLAAPAIAALEPLASSQQATKPAVHPAAPKAAFKPTLSLSIRDLGAVGDGTTKDTEAIRLTIERVSLLGGGEVVVPAGEYLTGAIVLRSNVTLRIEDGATLHGSPDMADYPLSIVHWEGRWIKGYIGFISAMTPTTLRSLGLARSSPATLSRAGSSDRADAACPRCLSSPTAKM